MKSGKNIEVFLVDDDTMFLRSLQQHLQQKLDPAVHVTAYPTGEECLRNLDKEPELVLMDYLLNEPYPYAANGGEVMRIIKRLSPSTEVVMLSSQEKMDVALDTIRNGAFDYLIKNDTVFLKVTGTIRKLIDRTEKIRKKRAARKRWGIAAALLVAGTAAVLTLSALS